MKDHGTVQATHEEICEGALKHYERISKECCDWSSAIPKAIEFYKEYGENVGSISDGYHTFDELYEHRIVLFIKLCQVINSHEYRDSIIWRSKLHSDGSSFDGWFIMGIFEDKGKQITYHLPMERWKDTEFARTLEKAPEFDGHTHLDVLERIANIL